MGALRVILAPPPNAKATTTIHAGSDGQVRLMLDTTSRGST